MIYYYCKQYAARYWYEIVINPGAYAFLKRCMSLPRLCHIKAPFTPLIHKVLSLKSDWEESQNEFP